jgi:HEAT repeat protein
LCAQGADEDLILQLKGHVSGQALTNQAAVETLVLAATGDPRRAAGVELRLLDVLQSDTSTEARQFVCRQLRVVGSDTCVPTLGRLLGDPQLAHFVRAVLESMPLFSAGAALRQALQTQRGELLVGVINSLGERREPASVPALVPLLSSRDAAVVQAAVVALGKIGGDAALDALRAVAKQYEPTLAENVLLTVEFSEDTKRRLDITIVFDALLKCVDGLLKEGRTDRAPDILARVYEAAPVPRPQQVAAFTALTRAAPDRAAPLILKLLRGRDQAWQAVAADSLRQLAMPSVAPILALLDTLSYSAQGLVIGAMADRADPALLFPLLKASVSFDPGVRLAALRALGAQEGNREIVQLLLGAAAGETDDSPVARASLGRLRGPEVEAALVAQLDQNNVAVRAEAARCLGLRGARSATPRLLKALADANAPIRFAALEGLGLLGGKEELPPLLTHLAGAAAAAEQEVAAKAVLSIARSVAATSPEDARAAAEKVLAAVTAEPIQAQAKQVLADLKPAVQ